MNNVLQIQQVSKYYQSAGRTLSVLEDIDFSVAAGTAVAIVGPSGSGKTTLLGLCAGLDNPSTGAVFLNNINITLLNEDQRAQVRNEHVGFIFQNFQLLPTLTALENVMVPMELKKEKNIKSRALHLLQQVGLLERAHHYPVQLSGGEQQRVSLARAFSNNPKILFADEPTGNLDAETSEIVTDLIFNLNKENNTTLILVTHDLDLAQRTGRIIRIKGGRIASDNLANINAEAV